MGFVPIIFAVLVTCISVPYLASLLASFIPLPKYQIRGGKLPKVSILIAAFNEEKVIKKTLRSLKKIDYPDHETIVICQGNDKTASIARKYARVIIDKSRGKWHALKLGARAAKGEVIYILDADSIPDRNALKKLVNSLGEYEIATGITVEEGTTPTATIFRLQAAFTNYAQYFFSHFLHTGIIQGKNYVMYKKTLAKIGGFKKAELEDANMTFRLYLMGKKVAVVDAKCSEQAPPKLGWYLSQQQRWAFGEQGELRKNLGRFKPIDWFTTIPAGFSLGYALPISAIFAILFALIGNVFFAYGVALGFAMYLVSAIKFLELKDVLLSPFSFVALSVLQTYVNVYSLVMAATGRKEFGGRTEKA